MIFVSYLTKVGVNMKKKMIPFEIKMLDNMLTRKICEKVKEDGDVNISHVQANILKYLYQNKNKIINQNDIEKEIGARKSTISGILNTMEKNDLIIRKESKTDGRKKEISLTKKSLEKHNKIEKEVTNFDKQLLKGISCEEEDVFFRVIDKLKKNLK